MLPVARDETNTRYITMSYMVQKQLKGAANSTLPLPLPVIRGEEKCWHKAPKNIVDGKSKIPSVRQ